MYSMLTILSASSFGVFERRNLFWPRVRIFSREYMCEAEVKYNLVRMCLQLSIYALFRYFHSMSYEDFSFQNMRSSFIF